MFGHNKSQKAREDSVKAVCGYKDSRGSFWETYEKAVESNKKHVREEEERDMVKEVTNYVHSCNFNLEKYDLKIIFTISSKEIYDIMHKHYSKEGL